MVNDIWEYLLNFLLQWKGFLYAIIILLLGAIMSFEVLLPLFGSISISLIVFVCIFIIFVIFKKLGIGWALLSLIPIGLFIFYVTRKIKKV